MVLLATDSHSYYGLVCLDMSCITVAFDTSPGRFCTMTPLKNSVMVDMVREPVNRAAPMDDCEHQS